MRTLKSEDSNIDDPNTLALNLAILGLESTLSTTPSPSKLLPGNNKLLGVVDISCDIGGAFEMLSHSTHPEVILVELFLTTFHIFLTDILDHIPDILD